MVALYGCSNETKAPDVSELTTDAEFNTSLLYLYGSEDESTLGQIMMSEDQILTDLYLHQIIFPGDTSVNRENAAARLAAISKESGIKGLNDTLHLAFDKELPELEASFKKASRYLKYYFPEYPSPNLYLCNTLFNYQKFIFEDSSGKDGLAVGGEMFINDYVDYKNIDPTNPTYSDYLTRTFNREHLVKKAMDMVVEELAGAPPGGRLLDYMIHNGKKLYILEHLMPDAQDTVLFEYTPEQMTWCKENELEMWGFFIEEKLFYETSPVKIAKFINDSPNSPGMPAQAPGRTANYLGLQIVKKYVENTPGMDIIRLIQVKDSQEILDKSRYKPARK